MIKSLYIYVYINIFILISLFTLPVAATSIQVLNVTLIEDSNSGGFNSSDNFTHIKFDLSWENSWRGDLNGDGISNWDAAWIFVKFRIDEGVWQHAFLSGNDEHHHIAESNKHAGSIEVGTTEINSYPRGMGVFLYRKEEGTGTIDWEQVQLRWNYGANGVDSEMFSSSDNRIDVQVFAIEMVYVPPGEFYAGDGTSTNINGHFHKAGDNSQPFKILDEGQINLGGTAEGSLGNNNAVGMAVVDDFNDNQTRTLPEDYPKGYDGFYSMKHSITQQQYVDFLNTLTSAQAANRIIPASGNRYGISKPNEIYRTTNPYVANNFMNWGDNMAYADWAGLRPMTELEYEKAARGPLYPVPDEFAWGTSEIFGTESSSDGFVMINAGDMNEVLFFHGARNQEEGSAAWRGTIVKEYSSNPVDGPVRVGTFYTDNDRILSGSSYWGIMELSGNVWERVVTTGNETGRSFTGKHGTGLLTASGEADVANWPGSNGIGSGYRGGNWNYPTYRLRVSSRIGSAAGGSGRASFYGFRAIRSLP